MKQVRNVNQPKVPNGKMNKSKSVQDKESTQLLNLPNEPVRTFVFATLETISPEQVDLIGDLGNENDTF